MKLRAFLAALVCAAQVGSSAYASDDALKTQTVCGWFENPTPGNASLQDRTGEWVIGIQGGHQDEGDWPELTHRNGLRPTTVTATAAHASKEL
jgi:hypothetical protein